ncbi:OmpA family protein [Achromobacter xylosoxidans]
MDVIVNEQSVSFRISNELLFASGQATLSPAGLDVIKRLAAILNKNEYQVSVEGHSDTVPIQTRQFASNWELSSSRATSVLRELVRDGVSAYRLRAVGYAETRPIESNETLLPRRQPPRRADHGHHAAAQGRAGARAGQVLSGGGRRRSAAGRERR